MTGPGRDASEQQLDDGVRVRLSRLGRRYGRRALCKGHIVASSRTETGFNPQRDGMETTATVHRAYLERDAG